MPLECKSDGKKIKEITIKLSFSFSKDLNLVDIFYTLSYIMAVNWMMLATAFVTIGFELIVFGLATAPAASFESSDHSVEALEVCGFVCLLIAFIVLMFMQYGELKGKRTAAGVVIGGSFLGGNAFHSLFLCNIKVR